MEKKTKKNSQARNPEYTQLEDVIGCKWSVSVLMAVKEGVNRPGVLERHIEGISTKILSERLRKLTNYQLLHKQVYAEVPLRTEYSLTDNGKKLVAILEQIRVLDHQISTPLKGADLVDNQ